MGYDMYWQTVPPEVEEAAQAYYDTVVMPSVRARDALRRDSIEQEAAQLVVEANFDHYYDLKAQYFRLNIFGMGWCRGFMEERGMLIVDSTRPTREEWDALPEFDKNCDDGGPAYRVACDELVGRYEMDRPGIPLHKLCDNSGWWVRPIEIEGALALLDKSPLRDVIPADDDGTPIAWWPRWLTWLKLAAAHDGFRVH